MIENRFIEHFRFLIALMMFGILATLACYFSNPGGSTALGADPNEIELVSAKSNGGLSFAASYGAEISADGRYVVFCTDGATLVGNDTNNAFDVFIKDTSTGGISRVSTDSDGNQANAGSSASSISADGRYVVFTSTATNLVAGDTNGQQDAFVKDTQSGITSRVSVSAAGIQGNDLSSASAGRTISADGRFVAFFSRSSNLVAGDNNLAGDVFVKDLVTGSVTVASADHAGNVGTSESSYESLCITEDGRYVAFVSSSDNLGLGIVVKDTLSGSLAQASTSESGALRDCGAGDPSISADGRYVAFQSCANNLVGGILDHNTNVFVKDMQTGVVTLVSSDDNGNQGNDISYEPSISADGRYVAFASYAANLLPGDEKEKKDVLIKDLQTNAITLASADCSGAIANANSGWPSITPDGRFVSFVSEATNLIAGDNNEQQDVFKTRVNWNAAPLPIDYYFPWYDNVYGQTWLLMASPTGYTSNNYDAVLQADAMESGIGVLPGSTIYRRYPAKLGGPVDLKARNGPGIVSQRSLFGNSFEEVWATPYHELSRQYWWPVYDGHNMQDWVLVSNPVENGYSVHATITLHVPPNPYGATKQVKTCDLAPGASCAPQFDGWASGPLEVQASGKVIVSQRVLRNGAAFNEMPGIPTDRMSSHYVWTWYDNASPGATDFLCIGNPNLSPINVQIKLAGEVLPPDLPIAAHDVEIININPPVMDGPLEITACYDSTATCSQYAPVFASQRITFGNSFGEIAGTADNEIKSSANWTWYDMQSPGSVNWILVANLNKKSIYYEINMPGVDPATTPDASGVLMPGERVTPFFPGSMSGPVSVKAWTDSYKTTPAKVMASQRVLWNGFFNEVVGKGL